MTEATGVTRRIVLPPDLNHLALLGRHDEHLRQLEAQYDVRITARGHDVTLRGEERQVLEAERVMRELVAMLRERPSLGAADIRSALRIAGHEPGADVKSVLAEAIGCPRGAASSPEDREQKRYLEAVRGHDWSSRSPRGTGNRTWRCDAISALLKRGLAHRADASAVRRGALASPRRPRGRHPISPPLRRAYRHARPEKVSASPECAIEIAPLAYMRGRTLNDAFIILDEAQNTTSEQMKMFLTRLGFNSKMVITGDITQVDLPASRPSGLIEVQTVLQGIDGIRFIYFDDRDVVRHDLVSSIVRAYDRVRKPSARGAG